MKSSFRLLSIVVGLWWVAAPSWAQSQVQLQQQMKGGAAGEHPPLPVHLNASLTQSVGSGTFNVSPFNPTVSSSLTLNPLIAWQGYTFLVSQTFGIEWTQSDSTTTANQVEMSDTVLAARYGRLGMPDLNLLFLPTLGYQLPLSMASRQAGSLGTATLGARGIWNVPDHGLSFYGQLSGGYALLVPSLANRFLDKEVRPIEDGRLGTVTPVTCNPRNPQELVSYGCNDGALPSQWRWSTGVGGSWSGLDGQLSVNLDVGYGQAFSVFTGPDDQFTADNAVAGLVPRQSTSGNLSLTWIPLPWLYLTVGANSFQSALTADGKGVRFPLWDFVSPYSNNSSLYLDTTISL